MEIFIGVMLGFLALRTLVSLFNLVTYPVLKLSMDIPNYINPPVSVLIPMRNEEQTVPLLTEYLNRLNYTNLEILILDDQSTDGTWAVLNKQNFKHNATILKGEPLKDGWLGKNWACHQLAMQAKGEYLIFLDADVKPAPHLIESVLQRMLFYKIDVLSLFPHQEMKTFGEKLVVPLMHVLLLHLLPLRLVRTSPYSSLAAANGQFMMFTSDAYKQHQFHSLVKKNVVDDVNIMRLAKQRKLKTEVLLGGSLISCRMYSGFKSAFMGFSKNLFAGFGYNPVGFFAYMFMVTVGWVLFLAVAPIEYCLLAMLLIICKRIAISKLAQQNVVQNLLLHGVQMIVYAAMAFSSVIQFYSKTTQWKGRKIY